MTNYEELKEAMEELDNMSKSGDISHAFKQIVYLAFIAKSLAKIADVLEQKGKEQE